MCRYIAPSPEAQPPAIRGRERCNSRQAQIHHRCPEQAPAVSSGACLLWWCPDRHRVPDVIRRPGRTPETPKTRSKARACGQLSQARPLDPMTEGPLRRKSFSLLMRACVASDRTTAAFGPDWGGLPDLPELSGGATGCDLGRWCRGSREGGTPSVAGPEGR
jgi:hypothetical protein